MGRLSGFAVVVIGSFLVGSAIAQSLEISEELMPPSRSAGLPWKSFNLSVAELVDVGSAQQARSVFQEENQPADAAPEQTADRWEFTFAPYLWASSLRAHADVGPVSGTADVCFSDLVQDLEMGAMARFEGIRNRWGFYLEGLYLKLEEDTRARVGPFRVRGVDVDLEFTQAELDFGGMYRFGDKGRSLDLMLGGRYTHLETDLSIGPFLDAEETNDFVSPMIGGRVELTLTEKVVASVKADVAGFGVGDAPDLTWGITALIGYRLTERTTFGIGYRYYDIDINESRVDLDVQYHGPMIGLAHRF